MLIEDINPILQKMGLAKLIPELVSELDEKLERNNSKDHKSWELTISQMEDIQRKSKVVVSNHVQEDNRSSDYIKIDEK